MSALLFPPTPNDGDTYEGYIFNAAKNVWQWQALVPSVESLSDTVITTPGAGQALVYDGTNWINGPGGGLVAVKEALKTDVESFTSVSEGGNVAVTGLSITHAVQDPANRLIISAFFGAAANFDGEGNVGIAVHDGTGFIAIPPADGNRTRLTAGGRVSTNKLSAIVTMPSVTFVHTPNTTDSKTYTVRAINVRGGTRTLIINRSERNNDDAFTSLAVSSLVIQEVAV